MPSSSPPSFTLHHSAQLPAPLPTVSDRILTPSEKLIRELCLASSFAIPELYDFHALKRVHVDLPAAATDTVTAAKVPPEIWVDVAVEEAMDGEKSEGEKRANATEVSFAFTEAVPLLCGLSAEPKVEASWIFIDAGIIGLPKSGSGEKEGGKGGDGSRQRVFALYRSSAEGSGAKVRVIKLRRLTPLGEDTGEGGKGTKLEESCSIWCPWGTGWWTKKMTDQGLKENMEWLEKLFTEHVA